MFCESFINQDQYMYVRTRVCNDRGHMYYYYYQLNQLGFGERTQKA